MTSHHPFQYIIRAALFGLVMIASLAVTLPAHADDKSDLKRLRQEIKKIERWLNSAQNKQSALTNKIQASDKRIGELSAKLSSTRKQQQREQTRLNELKRDQKRLSALQQQHIGHLKEQIINTQKLNNQGPVKLLLNQDNLQQVPRMMRLFDYVNQARASHIQTIMQDLARLMSIADDIKQQQQQLLVIERTLEDDNQRLSNQRQEQRKLLASLERSMGSKQQQLNEKRANRKRLEDLLQEVQTILANSTRRDDGRPFRAMRGRLPTPLKGRLLKAFGNRNQQTQGRWAGWLLASKSGQSVRAVHHGRVVFSDWLRGFGLLVIVDHGDSYLSLYAHNETLNKDVGDWVHHGDVISTSGQSGGLSKPRLYFEIRHKGRPQDPAKWIKRG